MAIPPPFSAEQIEAIDRLFEEKLGAFADGAKSSVEAAMKASDETNSTKLAKTVKDAIATNPNVLLATVQSPRDKTGGEKFVGWAQIIVPILLTISLGYVIWGWEKKAEDKIDHNTKFLEAQLALKQEYFKRKMDVFQEIWKQMAIVYSDANTAYVNPNEMTTSINDLRKFNELLEASKLYLTDDTQKALTEFWDASRQLAGKEIKPKQLDEKKAAAKDQVFKELQLSDMSNLPHPNNMP